MRIFNISSPQHYGGYIKVVFINDALVSLSFEHAMLSEKLKKNFLEKMPTTLEAMKIQFTNNVVIVEANYEVTFAMFWQAYAKKVNRIRAEAHWKKLSKTNQVLAYTHIKDYDKYLDKNEWRSKADPDTYLKNQYFLNEYK